MTSCQEATTTAAGPVAGDGRSRRAVVGLAAAGMSLIAVCYGLARFAFGLFVPAFRAEFGLDATAAGAMASAGYVGYCVAVVVAAAATTRWGPRPVAVLAGVCAAAGTALVAVAPSTAVLACGVVLAGSSTGLASPPLARAVAQVAPAAHEPRLQTVVNAGTGLGVLVSGPVALVVADDWRVGWAAFAAVALVVTLAVGRAVPRGAPAPADRTGARAPAGIGRPLLAAALLGVGSAAVWTFGKDVVTSGAGGVVATVMWIALGAAGLLGAFAGEATVRLGLARSWSCAVVLLAAATAALALLPDVPAAAVTAGAVFGAVYIALTGLLLLWGARVDTERPVRGVGAVFLLIAAGQALGAPLLGVVADAVTTAGAFVVAAAVLVLGALVRPAPAR